MTFDTVTLVGGATIVASYIIKVIGYPLQAKSMFDKKSADGVSGILFVTAFVAYILFTWYGYLKNDWVVMLSQGVGIITSFPVLYLIYKYRNNKTN